MRRKRSRSSRRTWPRGRTDEHTLERRGLCRRLTRGRRTLSASAKARYLRRPLVSEKAFQAAVLRVARENQWLAYHTFDSRRSPSGFPDVVLARAGSPLYAVELKINMGQVTPAQQAWLTALAGCTGVVSECWRPKDIQEIADRLRV